MMGHLFPRSAVSAARAAGDEVLGQQSWQPGTKAGPGYRGCGRGGGGGAGGSGLTGGQSPFLMGAVRFMPARVDIVRKHDQTTCREAL